MSSFDRPTHSRSNLPTPFNNKFDIYDTSAFNTKPKIMSSTKSSSSDRKSSQPVVSDDASILTTSTTNSVSALLKSKFSSKSKSSEPNEKQAKPQPERRISPQTLATYASLRQKAAKLFEPPTEDASDAYQARKGTAFLRGGSL